MGTQRARRRRWLCAIGSIALIYWPASTAAQTAAPAGKTATAPAAAAPTALQKKVEAYLRNLYAFGPSVQLSVSVPKESEVPGLLEATVDLKDGENTQSAKFYL